MTFLVARFVDGSRKASLTLKISIGRSSMSGIFGTAARVSFHWWAHGTDDMQRGLDVEKAEAALKRAAEKATHGTREERSGRFKMRDEARLTRDDAAKRKDQVYSWLGSGISLPFEKKVNDVLTIRPRAIESDIEKLRDKATSQFEYGLLCSIAPTITFELETLADTSKAAAINSWNNQYALIFLSVVSRAFVFHTIQVPGGYDSDPSKRLSVSFAHGISMLSTKPKEVSGEQLSIWVKLLPRFTSLMKHERFRFAVSVAGTLYVHPSPTVQVASIFSAIEALIDVDQELRFRISMVVAKLLTHASSDRILLFNKMKKLYDARSRCVHGGGLDRDKVLACRDEALEILRQLIIYAVERNEIPTRESLDELLVSS
jgi:Apea-like HEPN